MYLVTGAGGLIGSEVANQLCHRGEQVVGLDDDSRAEYFGPETSIKDTLYQLREKHQERFENVASGIEDAKAVKHIFQVCRDEDTEIQGVIHCAAQPSHDWATTHVLRDFEVNAYGTVNLLTLCYEYAPNARFVYLSTNKVYGDRPNRLDYLRLPQRYMPVDETLFDGFNEALSIDSSVHSFFGCSKLAGDLYAQEMSKYGMNVMVLRGGCLTGARHKGAELHGFLAYLVKCAVNKIPYTVCGYGGRQVRDNLSSWDVWRAIEMFLIDDSPIAKPCVYNIGGGQANSCSIIEAVELVESLVGHPMELHEGPPRVGDHRWWVTDTSRLKKNYGWEPELSLERIMEELVEEATK